MAENRRSFHQELDALRDDIVRLAAFVIELIPRGTEVFLTHDLAGAQELIEGDDVLDELALQIEDHCYQVLALQQPMASDLRAVVTAVRLVSEIERSGDLMVNVAKAARRLYGVDLSARLRGLLEQMSEEATRLYKLAVDSYAGADAALASALDDIDDRLDDLHVDYIEAIFESHHQGGLDLEAGVQLALIGRYYERIGDHAVNIGNRVQYMVTGWLPEHNGAARAQARARQDLPGQAGAVDRGVLLSLLPDLRADRGADGDESSPPRAADGVTGPTGRVADETAPNGSRSAADPSGPEPSGPEPGR